MKHSLYLSLLVALNFSGHLTAMENTTLEAPLPAQKFLFHQHVPSLLGLTLNTISREQLEDDKIRNLNLWNYAVHFKKNPERTNPVEALKLSLAGKILNQEEYKETVVMALKKRTLDCLDHLLTHAQLTQEILNDLLLEADKTFDVHAVNLLLSYHAKGEFFDRWQHSPLHNAVVQGDKEKVKELATAKTVNESMLNNTALQLAARYNQSDIVNILLPYASNQNKNMSLFKAIIAGAENVIEPLINSGADVEYTFGKNNKTLCICACSVSNTSALRSLLAHGADSNKMDSFGRTPLHYAVDAGCIKAVKLLIQHGAKIRAKNNDGNTPLRQAIVQEDDAIIDILLEYGADLHETNMSGETLLHAIAHNDGDNRDVTDMAQYLVDNGLDVNAESISKSAPIVEAVFSKNTKMITFLIRHGADIRKKNSDGETLLHIAALAGDVSIIQYLIDKGLDVNAQGKNGKRPLNMCLFYQEAQQRLLISHGAQKTGDLGLLFKHCCSIQ